MSHWGARKNVSCGSEADRASALVALKVFILYEQGFLPKNIVNTDIYAYELPWA